MRPPAPLAFLNPGWFTVPMGVTGLGSLLEWPRPWVTGLWWPGAVLQLWATVWVTGRWLRLPTQQTTGAPSPWVYITPVLLVAVVGNVVSALAGWGLGYRAWSMAQSAVGVAL